MPCPCHSPGSTSASCSPLPRPSGQPQHLQDRNGSTRARPDRDVVAQGGPKVLEIDAVCEDAPCATQSTPVGIPDPTSRWSGSSSRPVAYSPGERSTSWRAAPSWTTDGGSYESGDSCLTGRRAAAGSFLTGDERTRIVGQRPVAGQGQAVRLGAAAAQTRPRGARRPGTGGPGARRHGRRPRREEALLAEDEGVFFTTPHFNGYPAVLVRLERISLEHLRHVLVEAWIARAPSRLAAEHQDRL